MSEFASALPARLTYMARPVPCSSAVRLKTSPATLRVSKSNATRHSAADGQPKFRRGERRDEDQIKSALWNEKMNPLNIDPSRFMVAEDQQGSVIGFGQLEKKESKVYELRSLVVREADRGKGLGQALVQALLQALEPDDEVWLTTLCSTTSFYQKAGFQAHELDVRSLGSIPKWLQLEFCFGTVVAYLAVQQQLCIMHRPKAKPSTI